MHELSRTVIGVDVGGTKILAVVARPDTGEIVAHHRISTPKHDPAAVPVAIGDAVAAVATKIGWTPTGPRGIDAIGVGVPGLVSHRGVLRYGPNVAGVVELDVVGVLGQRFDVPVAATNDANSAALAEHRFGAARGARHAIVITQGTGIGGAFIVDGQLLTGAHGFAGEPGHMVIDASGFQCACGTWGCWEAVASGTGLANLAHAMIRDQGQGRRIVELAGGHVEDVRGEHVTAALIEGDRDALVVVDQFAHWVARGLANLVNIFDPEVIVLGGGLSDVLHLYLPQVQQGLMALVLGVTHRPPVELRAAALGPDAGAIGAALWAELHLGPDANR